MPAESKSVNHRKTPRTTIGLRSATKVKMDEHRAPGQCYDGFLCQMVDLWEIHHSQLSNQDSRGGKAR